MPSNASRSTQYEINFMVLTFEKKKNQLFGDGFIRNGFISIIVTTTVGCTIYAIFLVPNFSTYLFIYF